MCSRCHDSNFPGYEDYGAKGIQVADEWRGEEGFDRFVTYVGAKPTRRHSIDRYPNRHGNYQPGNVRWATAVEQAHNKDNYSQLCSRSL
jgi:hypothetical protein